MKEKTASKSQAQGAEGLGTSTALTVVKKRLSVNEKINSLHLLEALAGKVEYLRDVKKKVDAFGKSQDGFNSSRLNFKSSTDEDFTVSNPAIIAELVKICQTKITETLILAEKEIEAFEIA